MPACPTCGKKIALSWQMEKHQKSSRCKLYLKTKEFDRVSGELQVMCRNVEKLQSALLALEQEKQIYIPDPESRKHMDQIMNKLQQIWEFIQQERNFPEPHPANTSSSSICSTDTSPVISETQTIIPLSPENGNTNNLSVSASDRVISMHNELKEYLKHARPSVIKLAESHQVPHLIDLFSKLATNESENEVPHINHPSPPIPEQKISISEIIKKRENADKINTLQQISTSSDVEIIIRKDKPADPSKSILYQEISRYGSPSEKIAEKDTGTQINISDSEILDSRNSDTGKQAIPKITNIEDNSVDSDKLNLSATLQSEKVLTPNKEIKQCVQAGTRSDVCVSCDIGTQTIRNRKPHSAKALGK